MEEHGVSNQLVLDMLTLENDIFQRCLLAQPAPTTLQRFNRRKCSHLLRDLAATADLPSHSAVFSQQLLDLTHRWWSEAEDPDIDVHDVSPAAAAYMCIKLHSAMYPDLASFQLPDPRQPARSPTDLLTTLAAILDRRQPHNVPLLHSDRTVHEVVAEEFGDLYTPADWISLFEVRFSVRVQQLRQRSPQVTCSLLSRVFSGVLASGALCIADDYVSGPPILLG